MANYILGISCFYHDSAAALLKDGKIVAAAQEERFSRKKHDDSFPNRSIIYCLNSQKINFKDIDLIIYYENPFKKFHRLISTYIAIAPRGFEVFVKSAKVWIKGKLIIKKVIQKKLKEIQQNLSIRDNSRIPNIIFSKHHLSHAAAAFFPSPFNESIVLCMDGVGEWTTTSAWVGKSNKLKLLWEMRFPHSLGLLYSAFTYYCGFKVNSGEYKLMGLAPYGEPKYANKIKDNLISIKPDGTFRLDMSYFKFHRDFTMTSNKFHELFGSFPRNFEDNLTQFHMDLAASIQCVTEEIVLKISNTLKEETGIKNICLAGGVALNCVANGKLLKEKIFDKIWIQPASGDAGGALGAALYAWYQNMNNKRVEVSEDSMHGTFLGPEYSNEEIIAYLKSIKAPFKTLHEKELFDTAAKLIDDGKVIGFFNGPMEFGPRALGARSIIGDPRNKKMQSLMNLKIKYRESFRPFAPSILEEDVSSYFELNIASPYMLLVSNIKKNLRKEMTSDQKKSFGIDKLKVVRSSVPAITHVDYSARIQTVSKKLNHRYYNLINSFKKRTGCPMVVNTSFNVRGEPIVCNPQDAYRCFMRTEMDVLILQNQILFKNQQNNLENNENWEQIFELD